MSDEQDEVVALSFRGFTLIEVVVTLVVLGVLAAVAFPAVAGLIEQVEDRRAEAEAEMLARTAQAEHMLSSEEPPELVADLADEAGIEGRSYGELTDGERDAGSLFAVRGATIYAHVVLDGVVVASFCDLSPVVEDAEEFQAALDEAEVCADAGDTLTVTVEPGSTIDAAEVSVLEYSGPADLLVDGDETVTLTNSSDVGGILYADAAVEVAGSATWRDGQANDGSTGRLEGGAISADEVLVSGDVVFEGNTSQRGGAISADEVLVSGDAVFEGNRATFAGGAISADEVSVSGDVVFEGNTSQRGGAISADEVLVSGDAVFEGNTAAPQAGGAIYADDVLVSGDAVFEGNTAWSGGGAISADEVSVSDGVVFEGNDPDDVEER